MKIRVLFFLSVVLFCQLCFVYSQSSFVFNKQLTVISHDCYTRTTIGSRINDTNDDSSTTVSVENVNDCEDECSRRRTSCKAFSFGINMRGNASCIMTNRVPQGNDNELVNDVDYDIYVRRTAVADCHPEIFNFKHGHEQKHQTHHDKPDHSIHHEKPYPSIHHEKPDFSIHHEKPDLSIHHEKPDYLTKLENLGKPGHFSKPDFLNRPDYLQKPGSYYPNRPYLGNYANFGKSNSFANLENSYGKGEQFKRPENYASLQYLKKPPYLSRLDQGTLDGTVVYSKPHGQYLFEDFYNAKADVLDYFTSFGREHHFVDRSADNTELDYELNLRKQFDVNDDWETEKRDNLQVPRVRSTNEPRFFESTKIDTTCETNKNLQIS